MHSTKTRQIGGTIKSISGNSRNYYVQCEDVSIRCADNNKSFHLNLRNTPLQKRKNASSQS